MNFTHYSEFDPNSKRSVPEDFHMLSITEFLILTFVRQSASASQEVSLYKEIIILQRAHITKPLWSAKTDSILRSNTSLHLLVIGKIRLVFTYF